MDWICMMERRVTEHWFFNLSRRLKSLKECFCFLCGCLFSTLYFTIKLLSVAWALGFLKAFEETLIMRLGLQPLLVRVLIPHLGRGMKMYILLFYFDKERMKITWYLGKILNAWYIFKNYWKNILLIEKSIKYKMKKHKYVTKLKSNLSVKRTKKNSHKMILLNEYFHNMIKSKIHQRYSAYIFLR